jgi:hypothetical protein
MPVGFGGEQEIEFENMGTFSEIFNDLCCSSEPTTNYENTNS